MKKMFVMLCVLALTLSALSGCGQKMQESQAAASSAAVSGIAAESEAETPGEKEVVEAPARSETEETEPEQPEEPELPEQQEGDPQDEAFYAVCTALSKSEVEQFAKEVREMILSSDWEGLSQHISYPITVGGVTYEEGDSFAAADLEELLDLDAVAAIESEDCVDMFCNYGGIMMGNGEVWINEVLKEDLSSSGLWVTSLRIWK